MTILKYTAVIISAFIGLVVAFSTGPLSSMGAVVAIDESYIQTLQYQYYYSGLVTAVITCLVSYVVKANLKLVVAILLSVGAFWVVFVQSSNPEFMQYLGGAVLEFMVPYGLVCLVIVIVTLGINKKWPRLT
ncbi:MAG: hypothetical protein AB2817_01950 [Candidatus Thiodiazotropha sp.]